MDFTISLIFQFKTFSNEMHSENYNPIWFWKENFIIWLKRQKETNHIRNIITDKSIIGPMIVQKENQLPFWGSNVKFNFDVKTKFQTNNGASILHSNAFSLTVFSSKKNLPPYKNFPIPFSSRLAMVERWHQQSCRVAKINYQHCSILS